MSPKIESREGEREAILEVARLMQVTARTAPKALGVDNILTLIVYGEEKDAIAGKMEDLAEERKNRFFKRDAKNVRDLDAVVLIGVRGSKSLGVNCGACGYESCKEFENVHL